MNEQTRGFVVALAFFLERDDFIVAIKATEHGKIVFYITPDNMLGYECTCVKEIFDMDKVQEGVYRYLNGEIL
jgi:hypothetical protein